MAEDFLEDIYRESNLLFELKQVVEGIRMDDGGDYRRKLSEIFPLAAESCKRYIDIDYQAGKKLWAGLKKVSENSEDSIGVGLGDCLEEDVIPVYQEYCSQLGHICVDDGRGLCLESSASGFLTVKLTDSGRYLHSKVDPMWEAYLKAKQISKPGFRSYVLWGCGLGYLAYQLYRYSYGTARIKVYEPDEALAGYGVRYGVLGWIPDDKLEIHATQDILEFLQSIDNSSGFYIERRALASVPEEEREGVGRLLMQQDTERQLTRRSVINFYQNIANIPKTLSDFDRGCMKKEMVIVAGGPSVDDNMEYLRQMQGKKSIIAVGTVFSKLLQAGIRPDAVTILDPIESVAKQIDGCRSENIPLLIDLGVYWKVGVSYEGEKYLVCSGSVGPDLARGYVRDKHETLFNTGITVTTMAIRMALYFGAERIELAGADFSYPGNVTHAAGTAGRMAIKDPEALCLTECVDGGQVRTNPSLNAFRHEVEQVIAENKQVTFVNLSKVGARIKGTEENL